MMGVRSEHASRTSVFGLQSRAACDASARQENPPCNREGWGERTRQEESVMPLAPGYGFFGAAPATLSPLPAPEVAGGRTLYKRVSLLDSNPSKIANATQMGLAPDNPVNYIGVMSAIVEIESAIERLSPAEVKELAAWLEEYQQMVNASAEIFSLYDQEEKAGS